MEKIICKLSIAFIFTTMCATWIIPTAYKARGYWAIGGEWLILIVIFYLIYKAQ